MTPSQDATLLTILERSRSRGFLGPGSLRVQRDHALGFAAGSERPPGRFLDLGSGGGVPGLVLVAHWPAAHAVLLDASARRCAFLTEAAGALGCAGRVTVLRARAEEAGRRDDLRGQFDTVVARGFGSPSVTAECAAPFLVLNGTLIVSEPPGGDDDQGGRGGPGRWSTAGLAMLGLAADRTWTTPYHYRSFVLERPCPENYPRRDGVPAKRPLF